MPEQIWRWPVRDAAAEARIESALGVSPVVAAWLVQNQFHDLDRIRAFLYPEESHLHDPSLLPDFEAGADIVEGALRRNETIYIHGDYDADGVTSTAILLKGLSGYAKRIGSSSRIVPHVPNRALEGYGIHPLAIQAAAAIKAKVLITCDCGVKAHEQLSKAMELGMEVVVTDHHAVPEELPNVKAVINPHRADSQYPYAELCGAGVALKFIVGMASRFDVDPATALRSIVDLAAIGTVADMMPLTGENRVLVSLGLPKLSATKRAGLKQLYDRAGIKPPITAMTIGYQIGPRLNATGRIEDPRPSLDLLVTSDEQEAFQLAAELEEANRVRKSLQEEMVERAIDAIKALPELPPIIISVGRDWHEGIIGLVAGKVREAFFRPTIAITLMEDGLGKASCRSIPGFDMGQLVDDLAPIILKGGGHEQAAGFSFEADRIGELEAFVAAYGAERITEEMLIPQTKVDLEVRAEDITFDLIRDLELLEPHGKDNPRPVLAMREVEIVRVRRFGKSPTGATIELRKDNKLFTGKTFREADDYEPLQGHRVHLAFEPGINEFNGSRKLELTLRAWHWPRPLAES